MTAHNLASLIIASGVVGTLLPALISVINRAHWPSWAKAAVTVAASTAAGAVTAWAHGQFTGLTFTASALMVLGMAVASFHGIWKTSGLADLIEQATTPGVSGPGSVTSTGPRAA